MAIRAVIIAAENYPSAEAGGLVSKLEGTIDDAGKFRDWVANNKKSNDVPPVAPDITFLQDPTAAQISDAFRDLVDRGTGTTEELYVFFSGHGFSTNDNPFHQKPADILVGTEYKNLDSGGACLKLDEIQFTLYQTMGAGVHFYFIDACRNPISATKVRPGSLTWNRPVSNLGEPRVFTMFSAQRGNFAAVRSGFAPAVVAGLGGRGRAKRREDNLEMWVSFDSLRYYLETILSQKIDAAPGGGPGRILRIQPIPTYKCKVSVKNAATTDQFTATLLNALSAQAGLPAQVGRPVTFMGDQGILPAAPDDYFVQVTHQQFALKPAAPAQADLYDDCAVEFEKTTQLLAAPSPPAVPAPVPVSFAAPPAARIEITNLNTGNTVVPPAGATVTQPLQPGPYQVRVREPGWTAFRQLRFQVDPADPGLFIDAARRDPSPLRDSVVQILPGQGDASTAFLSETLGPMANQDVGLWLSLIGASRIFGADEFSKLRHLPLETFADVQPGASPVYVLAGAEGGPPVDTWQVAVWEPGRAVPPLRSLRAVQDVPGLYELRLDTSPGQHILSSRIDEQAGCATVVYTLPNRATLFVLATSASGETRIYQFILPLAKLAQHLSFGEQQRLRPMPRSGHPDTRLQAVRFMALAQKQMNRLRSPEPPPDSPNEPDIRLAEDRMDWLDLLYGKWLDPVMGVMAAYQLARQPKSPATSDSLDEALRNLRTFFSALPDVELIAKIAGLPYSEPTSLPLFLTGLRALDKAEDLMPFPAGKLEYSGPWITWFGV